MRILESKSQKIKILYLPAEEKIKVGDFVSFIEGTTTLIAQIFNISSSDTSNEYNQAELSLVFTYKYGKAFPWDGQVPSVEAKIEKTSFQIIQNYINQNTSENAFVLSYIPEQTKIPLYLDFKKLISPAFVGYENSYDNISFLNSFSNQISLAEKKIIIIDYNGNIDIENAIKITAGYEMKLPLNSDILEKLSAQMTEGISTESRAVIDEILLDLSSYAKQSPFGFIPINQLINVIEDIYKKSKISQLIILKNKLHKYQKQNIFANTKNDLEYINQALITNNIVIFDISNIPAEWQTEFIYYTIQTPKKIQQDLYLYLTIDYQKSDNKLLNYLLFKASKCGINPVLSANYRHISIETILDFCANAFLFKTNNALRKREYLSDIIQSLPDDYFITLGKLTSGIPIISKISNINDIFEEETENEPVNSNENIQDSLTFDNTNSNTNTPSENIAEEIIPDNINTPDESINNIVENENDENIFDEQPSEIEPINTDLITSSESEAQLQETLPDLQNPEPLPSLPEQSPEPISSIQDITLNDEEDPSEITTDQSISQEQTSNITEISQEEISINTDTPDIINELPAESISTEQETITEQEYTNEPLELFEQEEELLSEDSNTEINDEAAFLDDISMPVELIEPQQFEEQINQSDENTTEQNNTYEEVSLDNDNIEDIPFDDLDFIEDSSVETNHSNQNDDNELLDLINETNEKKEDSEQFEEVSIDDWEQIDSLSNQEQTTSQQSIEQKTIPIYDANYNQSQAPVIDLKEGDLVQHNKYGLGTVQKVTNYGNKKICHIMFEKPFGRRLLDPEISQLEKIQ